MNLPNKLTIFRILCIPVFVVLMLVNTMTLQQLYCSWSFYYCKFNRYA